VCDYGKYISDIFENIGIFINYDLIYSVLNKTFKHLALSVKTAKNAQKKDLFI